MNNDLMATFTARRIWIKGQLVEHGKWPEVQEILNEFPDIHQATAYRDLAAVAKELSKEIDIERLRLQVMRRVGDRVPDLADRDLMRLAVAFLPQKVEQKSEVKVESRTGDEIVELLKQYAPIAEQIVAESRGLKSDLPKDSSTKPVDPKSAQPGDAEKS